MQSALIRAASRGALVKLPFIQDIFKRASRVLMWLGSDEDGAVQAALDLIDKANNLARQEALSSRPRLREIKAAEQSLENNKLLGFPAIQVPSWNALIHLFQRTYFKRAWILQEVYQARSALAIIRAHRRDWNGIELAAHWLFQKSYVMIIPGFFCLVRMFPSWGSL